MTTWVLNGKYVQLTTFFHKISADMSNIEIIKKKKNEKIKLKRAQTASG